MFCFFPLTCYYRKIILKLKMIKSIKQPVAFWIVYLFNKENIQRVNIRTKLEQLVAIKHCIKNYFFSSSGHASGTTAALLLMITGGGGGTCAWLLGGLHSTLSIKPNSFASVGLMKWSRSIDVWIFSSGKPVWFT